MKAFLIDPFAHTVSEVDYTGDYKNIYTHIDADCFDVVYLNRARDCLFVDDNGLYRDKQKFFIINGYHEPLAGRALVLGTDRDGESISPQNITLDWLMRNVGFVLYWIGQGEGAVVCPPKRIEPPQYDAHVETYAAHIRKRLAAAGITAH